MKEIQLSQGQTAIVDDENFEWLSAIKWYASKGTNTYYAKSKSWRTSISMHRLICGFPVGFVVDHINGNGLDNRRSNLRIVSKRENALNAKVYASNKSGIRGIYFDSRRKKWVAQLSITDNGKKKTRHCGRFNTKDEAEDAYTVASELYHGINCVRRDK